MAEGVIDVLEQVEIEAADGEPFLLAPSGVDRSREPIAKIRAIAQPGERVVVGEIGDLGLGPLSLGDVDDRHQLAGVPR